MRVNRNSVFCCCMLMSGCSNPDFLNFKRGAWEVTSSVETTLVGAPADIQDEWNSSHADMKNPRVSRHCITGTEEEKTLFRIPSLPSCKFEVIRQSSSERILKMECNRGSFKQNSTYEFRFSGDNNYSETIQGTAERDQAFAASAYAIKTHIKNEGKYLGSDCSAFSAKSITELGFTSSLLKALGSGR